MAEKLCDFISQKNDSRAKNYDFSSSFSVVDLANISFVFVINRDFGNDGEGRKS